MPSIEIREADLANPTHAAGLIHVLDTYASEPMGGGLPLAVDVRERLIPELRQQRSALILLALRAEQVVGAAVCFVGFSTFAAKPLLNIHDLAVLPEARRQGVGRALLAAAQERASKLGCCKLVLEVRDDNHVARALYKSFGFGDFKYGEELTPTVFLAKVLS